MTKENNIRPQQELFDDVQPDASAMVESMRAHGYTLETAIADLIDNSIAADCRNVWLQFEWNGTGTWISVLDDGNGMSENELVNAMRLGSTSPLEERSAKDLGRFGLGLKTASFSQARRLTVRSKTKGGKYHLRRWDLDHLALPSTTGWQLLRFAHPDTGDQIHAIENQLLNSGTQVLLEVLDRVVGKTGDKASEEHFVTLIARLREHLEMVFHRYLSAGKKDKISIYINNISLVGWDPFVRENKATQSICDERFPYDPSTREYKDVVVKGFVLPHKDRFHESDQQKTNEAHRDAAGPAGWNAQQGFYLYRSKRLIVAGDWLGLGPGRNGWKQEEHYKLARILVDIDNATDHEWQIDVKKSTANPPPPLRKWLEGLAKNVRERAKEVYSHRGGYGPRVQMGNQHSQQPWKYRKRGENSFSYRIDRNNPVLKALITSLPPHENHKLETLLRLLEETVPIQRIWIDTSENQDGVAEPFLGEPSIHLKNHIKVAFEMLMEKGSKPEIAWELIKAFPAFQTKDALAIINVMMDGD